MPQPQDTYDTAIAAAQATGSPPKMTRPALLDCSRVICEEYFRSSLTLTIRQLYYQLVSRGLLANGQKHYKRVVDTCAKARLKGEFPMHYIEDRGRSVGGTDTLTNDTDVDDALATAAEQIGYMPVWNVNRARWFGQDTVVYVWVEKEALTGVFENVCNRLGVGLFACKGYPSVSSLHDWLKRAHDATEDDTDRECVVLYFGDHDPDGFEIPRSAERNLQTMLKNGLIEGRCPSGQDWNTQEDDAEPLNIRFERLALTIDQIDTYKPPSFPAKKRSSRYDSYVAETGLDEAWELDALEPRVLQSLVEEGVEAHFDDSVHADNRDRVKTVRAEMQDRMQEPGWIESLWKD